MSEDSAQSKRQRQKQRRQAKREAERTAQARARRRRLAAITGVVVILVGIVGVAVQRNFAERAAQREFAEATAARLDDVGCTEIEEIPDMGRNHMAEPQLAVNPPEEIYAERPGTSGPHMAQVALSGVYDKQIDERLLIHNLEHGYVVFWYDEETEPAQVEELQSWADERIDEGFEKIIVAEYHEPLPQDANFGAVAWNYRQLCEAFDADVAQVFLDERHDDPDVPEANLPAHRDPDQPGVVDPEETDGPLLFPPLGEDEVEEPPAMEDPADAEDPDADGAADGEE